MITILKIENSHVTGFIMAENQMVAHDLCIMSDDLDLNYVARFLPIDTHKLKKIEFSNRNITILLA